MAAHPLPARPNAPTQRQRRALLTEGADQGIGQHLGTAGHFQQPPDHGTKPDQQGYGSQGIAEAGQESRHDLLEGDLRHQRRDDADQHQGQKGMHPQAHDQQQ